MPITLRVAQRANKSAKRELKEARENFLHAQVRVTEAESFAFRMQEQLDQIERARNASIADAEVTTDG